MKGERMGQAGSTGYGASWVVRFTVAVVRLLCIGGLLLASLGVVPVRAVAPPAPTATAETSAGVTATYGKLPLAFEANAGQADAAARFVAHGQGFALALAPDALTLAIATGGQRMTARVRAGSCCASPLPGQMPAPALLAEAPLPGVVHYLVGNDPAQWHTNVPTSARVRYTDLYPGIDLTVYGTESGRLEYDAIVAPGADPTAFALAISGANAVTVGYGNGRPRAGHGGGRTAATRARGISGGARQRVPVAARYESAGRWHVGFPVGAYDATLPLVIDPATTYRTYLGGTGNDKATPSR